MRSVVLVFLCLILSSGLAAQAKVIRDIIYAEGASIDPGDVRMDIHLPEDPIDAPVLIMIHGGAWTYGNKHTYIGLEQARYFNRNGYIFIPINYRLAPDHPFPAAIEDAAAAIAWVHANIAEYGGDPGKIVLMGHSAGAHSVAMVSVDPTYLAAHSLSPAVIRGAIALDSAAYDLVEKGARTGKLPRFYRPAFGSDPEVWAAASPKLLVKPETAIPPLQLYYVQRAVSPRKAREFAEVLTEAGHTASAILAENRTHKTLNEKLGEADDPFAPMMLDFFTTCVEAEVTGETF